jgi:hypothetical protein
MLMQFMNASIADIACAMAVQTALMVTREGLFCSSTNSIPLKND